MFKLLQVFQQNVTEGPGSYSTSTHLWEVLLMLLGAAILGYLLRYFITPKTKETVVINKMSTSHATEVNEWEEKYKSLHSNFENNKKDWQIKLQSAEDRSKTFQTQLTTAKGSIDSAHAESTEWSLKLRAMEGKRNEALEEVKNLQLTINDLEEKLKGHADKVNVLSASLSASNSKLHTVPAPIVISDEELTNKFNAEMAVVKKQLDDRDNKLISLLSKEAAANELQIRNEKLAAENNALRAEVASNNGDVALIEAREQKAKDLEMQLKAANAKASAATSEIAVLKKQIADEKIRDHKQAENLNQLRNAISAERSELHAKIASLEAKLTPANETDEVPAAAIQADPTEEVTTEAVTEVMAEPVAAPVIEIKTEETTPAATTVEVEAEVPAMKMAAPTATVKTPVGKQDDIEVVEGIGPKVKELLHAEGIDTWNKLAATEPEAIKTILTEKGGERFQMMNPGTWPKQAQLLAEGKWEEFKTYTDWLIGGVEPTETKAAAIVEKVRNLPAGIKLDDLKIVEGIGPKIAELLNEGGITTWAQLAAATPESVKAILMAHNETTYRIHDTGTWPQQAQLADDDQWEALKKLQDELDGGKPAA